MVRARCSRVSTYEAGVLILRDAAKPPHLMVCPTSLPLIPTTRRLHKSAIPCRADEDLVDANSRRHAGDKGDGAAEIFGLKHAGLLLFRGDHRPQFEYRGCDLARRQAAGTQA